MSVVLITIVTLAGLGAISAVILYLASKKFQVFEDPRIDEVEEALHATN
jgi:electron transport complex protein RnfB